MCPFPGEWFAKLYLKTAKTHIITYNKIIKSRHRFTQQRDSWGHHKGQLYIILQEAKLVHLPWYCVTEIHRKAIRSFLVILVWFGEIRSNPRSLFTNVVTQKWNESWLWMKKRYFKIKHFCTQNSILKQILKETITNHLNYHFLKTKFFLLTLGDHFDKKTKQQIYK